MSLFPFMRQISRHTFCVSHVDILRLNHFRSCTKFCYTFAIFIPGWAHYPWDNSSWDRRIQEGGGRQYSHGWIDSVTSPIKNFDRTTKISDNITKYCVPTKVIVQCSPVLFCFRISCFGISFGFDLIFFHMCSQILFPLHPKVTLFWKDSLIGDIGNMNIYSLSRKYVKQDIPKETINTNKKDTEKDTCNHTVLTWHHEHCWIHA